MDALRTAASHTVNSVHAVAANAFYVWPDDAGVHTRIDGLSYSMPKEEQVRSELYRQLAGAAHFELEWNIYAPSGRRGPVGQVGEVDLVGFDGGAIAYLLEIKRVWHLDGWVKKLPELIRGVQNDVEKLAAVLDALRSAKQAQPRVAGVVVATYARSGLEGSRVRGELSKVLGQMEELAVGDRAVGRDANDKEIWMRIDLLPVVATVG